MGSSFWPYKPGLFLFESAFPAITVVGVGFELLVRNSFGQTV